MELMNEKGNPEKGNPSANEPWEKQDKHILPSQEKGNNESGQDSNKLKTRRGLLNVLIRLAKIWRKRKYKGEKKIVKEKIPGRKNNIAGCLL